MTTPSRMTRMKGGRDYRVWRYLVDEHSRLFPPLHRDLASFQRSKKPHQGWGYCWCELAERIRRDDPFRKLAGLPPRERLEGQR